jgi:hypothetical protein
VTDRHFRKATYPTSIEYKDELAHEFAEFGYRETSDPKDADRRNFYKVEKWDAAELHVGGLIHASNDLVCARAIFDTEKKRRLRGRALAAPCATLIAACHYVTSPTVLSRRYSCLARTL